MTHRIFSLLLLVLLLAGCVAPVAQAPAGSDAGSDAAAAPAESAESAAGDAFPVTIEHKFGSTTVEAAPQRVLALGFTDQDPILALGIVPVAVRYFFGPTEDQIWPWAEAALGDGETTVLNMPFGELNFEAVAALQPDLIVAISAGLTAEEYATLSQIAPTLAQSDAWVDFGVPWQEQTVVIGRALGKEAEAGALVEQTEALIAETRAAHPELEGATAAIASPAGDGQYFFSGPQHERQRFLTALGLQLPETLAELAGDSFYGTISAERMDLLDTDVLLWTVVAEQRAAIEADPVYQALAVAQEGRDIFLDTSGEVEMAAPALIYGSVLSWPTAVELLVPQLAERLGGGE